MTEGGGGLILVQNFVTLFKNAPLENTSLFFSDNDGDVVNGLLMVQFDMVDMLRKKRAQKKYQRKRSDRRSLGNYLEFLRYYIKLSLSDLFHCNIFPFKK